MNGIRMLEASSTPIEGACIEEGGCARSLGCDPPLESLSSSSVRNLPPSLYIFPCFKGLFTRCRHS